MLNASTYFWVGNGGNWSDANHWSTTSGGVGNAGVPGVNDLAVFDQNSFNSSNQVVTVGNGITVGSLQWGTNVDAHLQGIKATLNLSGSLNINKSLHWDGIDEVRFIGSGVNEIYTNGNKIPFNTEFDGSGRWTFKDNYVYADSSIITVRGGQIHGSDVTIFGGGLNVMGSNSRVINFNNSVIYAHSAWDFQTTNLTWRDEGTDIIVNTAIKDRVSVPLQMFGNFKFGSGTKIANPCGSPQFTLTATIVTNYNGFGVSCADTCNGVVNVSVAGGVGPFRYQWTGVPPPSDTLPTTDSVVCQGNQGVVVTDMGQNLPFGQPCNTSVFVLNPTKLSVSLIGSLNPTCADTCDAIISTFVNGGTAPVSLVWAPGGQTTSTINNICDGTHFLSVVDTNGCTVDTNFTVNQPAHIVPVLDSTDVSCFNGCDGTVRVVSTTGGSGTYVSYLWMPGGATTQTVNGLCPGMYTVTVTDDQGCIGIDSIEVGEPPQMVLDTSHINISCGGACDGLAAVRIISGGTPPFTHSWSNGSSNDTISGLCPGIYTDTVTDASGCDTIIQFNITEPPPLTSNAGGFDVTCNGSCDGIAFTVAGGGTPGYSYSWSPGGATTDTITGLCPGQYVVTITDANGCSLNDTVNITEPAVLQTNATGIDPSCNGTCDGSVLSVPTGGTTPYSFVWNPGGQTSPGVNSLCAGQYIVTVTDSNGCQDIDTVNLVDPPVINGSIAKNDITCNGLCDGNAKANVSGGSAPYTYSWSPGGQTTDSIFGLCQGNYIVTIRDANNCQVVVNTTINEPPPIILTVNTTDEMCNGDCQGTAKANVSGGTGPYTYSWAPGGATTDSISGLCANNYTVTVTDANGCVAIGNGSVNTPPLMNLNSQAYHIDCHGSCNGAAVVSPSGGVPGYSYSWNPGGQTTDSISGLCAGQYIVTVTDAGGCVMVDTINVNEPDTMLANVATTDISCNGACDGTATALPTGGRPPYTYAWVPGGQTTQGITGLCQGNYTVTVTDSSGCTAVQQVTINEPPPLTTITTPVSASCGTVCDGVATTNPSGGTAPYTYLWTPSGQTTQTASNLCAGFYTVTITDSSGCSIQDTVTVQNLISITVSADSIKTACNGLCDGRASASATGGTAPYTFVWNPGGIVGPIANNLCPGNYTVTATDSNGCQTTIPVTIPVDSSVLLANGVGVDPSCNGLCDGSASSVPTGGTPPFTYLWGPGGQTTTSLSNLCAGTYTISVTDSNGCVQTDTIVLTDPDTMTFTATVADIDCNGNCNGTITLVVTGGTGPYSYAWAPGGQTTANLTGLCAGNYTVTVTDANGCTKVRTYTIQQPPNLGSTPLSTDVTCNGLCDGTASVLVGGGTAPYTYFWSPGGQTTQNISNLCAGNYTVLVTDSNGCTTNQLITINEPGPIAVSLNGTDPLCNGTCDGTITANVTGGTAPFAFLWAPGGQTTSTISNLCSGNYSVTVTDTNGCATNGSTVLIDPFVLTVAITSTDANCNGACDGTAKAVPSGGVGPYTYSWVPGGQTTDSISGLCQGVTTVTVTDNNGCFFIGSAIINEPPPMLANDSVTDANCGFCDGVIRVAPTGGTSPYSISWSPGGQTTATITNLCAGPYQLTLTDLNGCVDSFLIPVSNIGGPSGATVTQSDATCFGSCDGAANVIPIGGTPPYTYSWIPGGQTTASVSNLCATTHTVTITDANGCQLNQNIIINEPDSITDNLVVVNALCNGSCDGSASVNPTGGTGPYTFIWTPGGATGSSISGLCVGAYSVQITDFNGCTKTVNFNVAAPNALSLSTSSTAATCNGNCDGTMTVNITGGTGPFSYNWSTGHTTQNVTGVCAGSYSVIVTDVNGCMDTATVNVSEPSPITIAQNVTLATCGACDGAITVTPSGGTGPYSYFWNNSATVPTIGGLCPGVYTVTVTDANNCSAVFNIPVGSINGPTTSHTFNNASCAGVCDGSATVTAVGGLPPYSFLWTPGGQTTNNASGLCAGVYLVQVTDANGCVTFETITISDNTAITVAISSTDASCNGVCDGTAQATPSGGTPPYSYLWSNSSTLNATIGLCAGSHSVTVTDALGCQTVQTFNINEPAPVGITFNTVNAACSGACTGQATAVVTGGTGPYTYNWSTGSTSPTTTGLCAGTYTVTVTDANGCSHTDSVNIIDGNPITAIVNTTTATCGVCDGTASVTPSGGSGAPYTYLWSPGGMTTSNVSGLCPGAYTVTVTDNGGCTDNFVALISNPNGPTLNMAKTDVTCNGACDGTATANVTAGTPAFTYQWNDPGLSTTSTATGLCAGIYSAVVQDGNGCITVDSITVNEPSQIQSNLNPTNPSCPGVCDGAITANPSGGSGSGYTYSWSPGGATTQTASGFCAGVVVVTITDGTGCSITDSITLVDPSTLNVLASGTSPTCNGDCDATAIALVSGGTGPYTYAWAPGGQTTNLAVGLCASNYTVTVTDANGCTANANVTINDPPVLSTSSVVTNATCNGVCDGQVTTNPSGGSAPYTYQWSTGSTTQTITNLCAGTYSVIVVDANNCTAYDTVTVSENNPIVDNTVVNGANCGICDGSATATPTGGTGPYSYLWMPGAQTTQTATGLCAGLYTLYITDNGTGCLDSFQIIVNNINGPTVSLTPTDETCAGSCDGQIAANVSGGTTPYTYLWSPSAQTTATATGLCVGQYIVTVTDSNGCITIDTASINTVPFATNIVASNDVTCNGNCDGNATAATTGGVGPFGFNWNPGGQTTASVTGLCAGVYTVTGTDSRGCQDSSSVVINEPPILMVNPALLGNCTCNGSCDGTVNATPTGGTAPYAYSWNTGGTASSITGLCAGWYICTVTDANGCTATDSIQVTEPAVIQANDSIVLAACGMCNGEIHLNPTGGTGPYTYLWTPGGQVTQSIVGLCAGIYSVTITDANGCTGNFTIGVSNPNGPNITMVMDSTLCNGSCNGQAFANVTGGTPGYNYLWNDPLNQTTPTATGLCAGVYGVTVTDAAGCVTTAIDTIREPDALVSNIASTNVLCANDCNGTVAVNVTGGTPGYGYTWLPGGMTTDSISSLCPGTYIITITDNNGCQLVDSATVTGQPALLIDSVVHDLVTCSSNCDATATVYPSGGNGPYTYNWSGGQTTQVAGGICFGINIITVTDINGCTAIDTINVGAQDTVIAIAPGDTTICEGDSICLPGIITGGNYFVWYETPADTVGYDTTLCIAPTVGTHCYVLFNTNGNCVDYDTVCVTVAPLPVANAGPDVSIIEGKTTQLSGSGGVAYIWSPDSSLTDSSVANPVASPSMTTTYHLTVISAEGCRGTDSVIVTVIPTIDFPNGITPNGDGKNDTWVIDFLDQYPNHVVEIYNRWGEMLYRSTAYKNDWDGTYKGKELPVGTYYYIIELNEEGVDPFTGPITIMR